MLWPIAKLQLGAAALLQLVSLHPKLERVIRLSLAVVLASLVLSLDAAQAVKLAEILYGLSSSNPALVVPSQLGELQLLP